MARSDSKERPADAKRQGPIVPAAARTLALFEVFAREKRELTKSELARFLDLRESSCSDLLNTLHELGYVSRTANSKRYYPTGRLLASAREISENDPLAMVGEEAVKLLSQRSGETGIFGVLDGDGVKIVAVCESSQRLRYVVTAGDRASLHATSLGKALLGGSADTEMSRLLRLKPLTAFTGRTHTDPVAVESEIREQRLRGWYSASDEGGIGISSYATSARTDNGLVALSLIGPTQRMLAGESRYVEILKEVAASVFGGPSIAAGGNRARSAA